MIHFQIRDLLQIGEDLGQTMFHCLLKTPQEVLKEELKLIAIIKVDDFLHLKSDLRAIRTTRQKKIHHLQQKFKVKNKSVAKISLDKIHKKLFLLLDKNLRGEDVKDTDSDSADEALPVKPKKKHKRKVKIKDKPKKLDVHSMIKLNPI